MDKTKIPGVKASRVGSDHKKIVFRYWAVKLELWQGASLAVLVQGLPQLLFIAGEQLVRINGQNLPWTASDLFDQAIIFRIQTSIDKGCIIVPENEIITRFDFFYMHWNKEEHPVL